MRKTKYEKRRQRRKKREKREFCDASRNEIPIMKRKRENKMKKK